jgi:putative peptidoglycan lipid II flippase
MAAVRGSAPGSPSAQVARSASVVSLAILTSRITGLVREMVMAQKFGAGYSYDAFLLGFRIPNLTRALFAEGALSSAFVPTFTSYLSKGDRAEAARLSNLVGTALIVIVGVFCLVGMLFSPQLVWMLAPGYATVPGKFELAVHMTRLMFPFLLLVALAAQAMGVLNSCDKFGVPALASTFFNIGSVCAGLMLGFWLGPSLHISPISGMAIGVVIGGALQLLWQVPSLNKAGFRFHLDFAWNHPGLRQIFRLMVPAIIGNAAIQVNVMVNTNFASRLTDPFRGQDGPVSWLGYAFRFMQLPLGIFGVSFASAILPSVSRSIAAANYEECRRTLSRSVGMVLLMSVPSSVGLALLGRPIIGAIFQSGKFQLYDTEQTALALSCYAIGLAGYAATKVLTPVFYALSDSKTPMYISLLSIVVNICAAEFLLTEFHLGISALALATSAVAIVACVVLFAVLRGRLGGIDGRYLLNRVLRICLASAMMAGPVWGVSHYLTLRLGYSRAADLVNLALSIPVGLLAFAVAAKLLGLGDSRLVFQALRTRLQRLLSKPGGSEA